MQSEEQFDDLSTLFEAQDEDLQSEAFVEKVMQPIHKRAQWRAPLLFGAGGIGIGAALSQMSGLLEAVKVRLPDVSVSFAGSDRVQMATDQNAIWVIAAVIIIIGCTAIVASERG